MNTSPPPPPTDLQQAQIVTRVQPLPAIALSRVEVVISWSSVTKVLLGILAAFLSIRLWPLFELLFVALLVAMTLWPLRVWIDGRGNPKWAGILLCGLLLFGVAMLFGGVVVPAIMAQVTTLIERMPTFKDDVVRHLPDHGPLQQAASQIFKSPAFADSAPLLQKFMEWSGAALQGVAGFLLTLVLATYFIADGPRIYDWMLAFLPELQRQKVHAASREIAPVVGSYMGGQAITSLICGGYVFLMLSVLHVPNPLLLAVLAGIFDVLPLIGFFLALLPSLVAALSVSATTAGLVVASYTIYHLVENYVLVPRIYGNRLRLSTLTVLVSCLAAGMVGGVVGAIVILPVIASYPIIERLWLRPLLEKDTVKKHREIDEREHPSE